ncbi:MAG: glycosyltransferase family 39 protein [Candidatus Poribacteria bacterium]|nr:glycosyltransferase family 39 protein [Candidatus Poribacteria bacterium]
MLKFSTKHCPKKMQIALLSVIVLFGVALRFWNLGQWSFWIDEVFTVRDAQSLSFESWRNIPNPIPYLAVKLSISLAGSDEWGSRLIPCLIGIISIPVVFGLGRTLFNWQVGLLSGAFVACSSWHLFWAQNARYPVFTFLFAILTAWFFYLSLERDSTLLTIGALVSCLCLILSHTLSVVIVPALSAYAMICLLEKSNRKRWLNLLIFFIPFAIPVLALALPDVRGYLFSGWGRNVWQRSPLYIVLTLVQGVSIPVAVAAFFGFVATPINKSTRFLLCYAGVPLVLFLIASQLQNVAGYYLFWTTPAYFILAGVACERVWKAIEMKSGSTLGVLVPCVLLVTLLSQNYLYFRIENGGRPKWREAFEAIRTETQPTDKVVLSEPEMGRYYLPELTPIYIGGLLDNSEAFEKEWETSGRKRLWFLVDVASFNVFDANENVRNWIRQRGHLIKTFPAFSRAKDRTIHVYLLE